jgi:peptidoglycan-associated lipoprotein
VTAPTQFLEARGIRFAHDIILKYKEGRIVKTKVLGIMLMVAVFGFLLSGCGCFYQAVKGEAPPPPTPEAKVEAPPPAPPATEAQPEAKVEAPPPAPVVMLNDIHFDFDKYNIRPQDAEILKADYGWFNQNPGRKVSIEGNCDERGTVEYNLALGQRRADSTKSYLMNLGADGSLLETISYGKERPLCREHNEECWAQNRRAHFTPAK